MLANLRPIIVRLEDQQRTETPLKVAPGYVVDENEEFEVVFSGKDSLSKFREE